MKSNILVLCCAVSCAISKPFQVKRVELAPAATTSAHGPAITLAPHCLSLSPDTSMPLQSDVRTIVKNLLNKGNQDCILERAKGSTSPAYKNLGTVGTAEINLFFTNKPGTTTAYRVAYPCKILGEHASSLLDRCAAAFPQSKKVQAFMDIPNCSLKKISHTGTLGEQLGATIEIMPKGTRS